MKENKIYLRNTKDWAVIPKDWYQVTLSFDKCEKGDMFFNLYSKKFEEVEEDDIGLSMVAFDCLIRKKK